MLVAAVHQTAQEGAEGCTRQSDTPPTKGPTETKLPSAGRRCRSEDLSRRELGRHSTQADQRPTVFYLPHMAQPTLVHKALQYLELADRVAGSHDHAAEDVLQSWLAIVGSRCVSITSPTPASRASSATSRVEM